jgi:hypothetical protein
MGRKFAMAAAAALATAGLAAVAAPTASAASLDGKDPYTTGCNGGSYSVKSASIKNELGDSLGTVYLYWSPSCKTNWTEARVSSIGTGSVNVYTDDGRSALFNYKAGNGGHHWGNMLYAPGICAWGQATVNNGTGRLNHGSGSTARACG